MRVNGTNLELSIDGTVSSRPLDSVSSVSITGAADVNDTLTVDLSGGAITVPISFDGGSAGYDTLVITGSTASVASTATGPQSGVVTVGQTVVTYTGLEPVTIGGDAADGTFTLTGSDDQALLTATRARSRSSRRTPASRRRRSRRRRQLADREPRQRGRHDHDRRHQRLHARADDRRRRRDEHGRRHEHREHDLNGTDLAIGSRHITLTNIQSVTLNGGAGGQTFTVQSFTGGGTVTLNGGAGSDTFALGTGFGTVTVNADGGANDLLDLSGLSGTVAHPNDTTFTNAGSTATISGSAPEHIDIKLGGGLAADVTSKVDQLLDKVSDVVAAVDTAGNALGSILPLLDPSIAASVDKLVKLVDSFSAVKAAVDTALGSLTPLKLSDIKSALNSAIGTLSSGNPLKGIHFDTGYESFGGDFVVYLTATLTPGTVTSCSTGPGCVSTSVPLDFGDRLDAIGISLDSDTSTPGTQPPVFTARATIGLDLALGVNVTTTGTPFLRSDGHIDLAANASITTVSATVALGLLSATISSGSITIAGTISLALVDTGAADNHTLLTELGTDAVTVTAAGTISNPITLNASIGAGVRVGGSDLSLATAELVICFGADCTSTPVTLFDSNGNTPNVNVSFHTDSGWGHDLLNSLTNATSFSNAGPNEILSMLGQVASFFSSMASQSFLGSAQIPFTSITLGQALDYAKEFTHNVIDPLFKSGDSTHPDANGDGRVDVNDFNFSSIQNLLDRLEAALGLPTGFLKADYDPAAGTLEFNFSLDKTIGIGTGVDMAPSGAIMLDSAPDQGGPNFTLDAGSTSAFYKVTYNGHSTGDLAWNASLATVSAAIAGITGIPAGVIVDLPEHGGHVRRRPVRLRLRRRHDRHDRPERDAVPRHRRERRHVHPLDRDERGQRHHLERLARDDPGEPRHAARRRQGDRAVRGRGGACNGGAFQIVYNLGTVAGTDVPLIAVDSTQLTNANNRKQIVTVPAGTADFWLSFVNGSGGIELTDKIVSNITAGGLKTKLAALPSLTGHIASVARVDGDTTAYLITFTTLTNMHTLGAAGGFSLDFGASLGGLASLTTTGSIIPLARLVAT